MTTQHGYLLLTGISGYPASVAGTELDHFHEILGARLAGEEDSSLNPK